MHSAPSVRYPVGRSRILAAALVVIWFVAVGTALAWFYLGERFGWRQWLELACLLASGLAASAYWWAMPTGVLHWDGQCWAWEAAGAGRTVVQLGVQLDLQRSMLLRLAADHCGTSWCFVERATNRARWNDLRRAAHAPAGTSASGAIGGAMEARS
jgi:toxin CptA